MAARSIAMKKAAIFLAISVLGVSVFASCAKNSGASSSSLATSSYISSDYTTSISSAVDDKTFSAISAVSAASSSAPESSSPASDVSITSVSLNQTTLSLTVGQTAKLSATVAPSTATNKAIKWTVSDLAVITHDSNGNITAKGNGTAYAYATAANGVKASCKVTVTGGTTSKVSDRSGKASSSASDYYVTPLGVKIPAGWYESKHNPDATNQKEIDLSTLYFYKNGDIYDNYGRKIKYNFDHGYIPTGWTKEQEWDYDNSTKINPKLTTYIYADLSICDYQGNYLGNQYNIAN